jgi:putative oxidoreductase
LCLIIYLLVATYLGHHFSIGFIWALPGGGWEYPILWASLIFSFIFFGGGGLSIDRALRDRYRMPRWILLLMGSRHF